MEVLLAVGVAVCIGVLALMFEWQKGRKLPPGPYPIPIVGNLLQVGKNPQHSFAELSKKYGPLMSIRFGSVLNVVVSSPQLAKQVLTRQYFMSRIPGEATLVHDVHNMTMTFLPVTSDKWRRMRKISRERIFANQSMEASQALRQDNLQQLLRYVEKLCDCGGVVDVCTAAFTSTLNLMSSTLFSTEAADFESDLTSEFKEIVEGVANVFGEPNLADFFPLLKRFDPQSVRRRSEILVGRSLRVMEAHLNERLQARRANAPNKNDFLETLLDISTVGNEEQKQNMSFKEMEMFLLELYIGGTISSSSSIEWVMTELLKNPDKMSKAKGEVRKLMAAEDKKIISDSDISRLPYLQAVVYETFRLHPPTPFLFPHSANEDSELEGYLIPKDTRMVFNVWGMGRDPSVWPNAESFEPERFIDTNIDYKGLHPQLIPFGSGKRICPGLPLAHRVIHAGVAALIGNFDWVFAPGEKYRNAELFCGLTLRREAPLKAIPLKPLAS